MSGIDDSPIVVGKIRLDVPKLAELKTPIKSPVVYIANMPWYIYLFMMKSECSERTSNVKQLSVFLYCNEANKSTHWSCEATVIYNLLSPKVGQKWYSRKTDVHTYNAKQSNWGLISFIAWDEAVNPANGFIREEDGGVTVEATVTITKVIGLLVPTLCDFTAPQPNLTDVALIVEETPLLVNKAYLAYHSPVFHSMFFSEFAEKEKKEIPLPDVTYDEFVELLHQIYPSRKPIEVATVEGLLHLADRFNMQVVLHSCDEFLQGPDSEEIPLAKKLLFSDQYRLASLQYICLNKIKTVDEVRVIKKTKEYGDFSRTMIDALLERSLELR